MMTKSVTVTTCEDLPRTISHAYKIHNLIRLMYPCRKGKPVIDQSIFLRKFQRLDVEKFFICVHTKNLSVRSDPLLARGSCRKKVIFLSGGFGNRRRKQNI